MKNAEEKDADRLRKRFPTLRARLAADRVFDALPATATMQRGIDTWIAEYRKSGGKEPVEEE